MIDINAFFTDWYNALQFATTQASLAIDPIVTAVDPAPSMSIGLANVLTALIAGLPFIGSPVFGAEITASAAAKAFVTGLQQAPGLVKALYPTGSAEVSFFLQVRPFGRVFAHQYDSPKSSRSALSIPLWLAPQLNSAIKSTLASGA